MIKPIFLFGAFVLILGTARGQIPEKEQGFVRLNKIGHQAKLIGDYYDVQLPVEVLNSQSVSLNAGWFENFRKKTDLQSDKISRFLASNPDQLVAVRNYFQQLLDNDYVTYDFVVATLGRSVVAIKNATSESSTTRKIEPVVGAVTDEIPTNNYKISDDRPTEMQREVLSVVEQVAKTKDPAAVLERLTQGRLKQEVEQKSKDKLGRYFDNAEVSVDAGDGKSSFEVNVLKAYDVEGSSNSFPFSQIGLNGYDGRTTLNLGTGYRVMPDHQLWMLGGNVFYDHEFPDGHQRGSIGVEFVSAPFKLNANRYLGISGYKQDSDGGEAKVSDGFDIKADIALPYFPNTYFTVNQFKWFGQDGATDLEGRDLGLKGNLSKNLSLEIYRRDYDSTALNDRTRANLKYQWSFAEPQQPFYRMNSSAYELKPIEINRYRMVERENRIVTQKKFSVTVKAL